MKALLVEDNPADARLIREILKDSPPASFQVEHVPRLDTALERLRHESFDVVLLDLDLPDAQGMQTLARTQQASDGTPIVVLTGLNDERVALQAVSAGAQDYLVKGRFDTELLTRTIRYAVERKRAEMRIQKERQRLHDVLETLPVMICLLTPDYHVAFANRAFRERFGESRGRHCYDYCFGNSAPCEFCESFAVLKTGRPHHWEVNAPGGSVIDVYDFPFTDVDGSPLILEMDMDVTEIKEAQTVLQEANETLEQRVAERTAQLRASNDELLREMAERKRAEAALRRSEEHLRVATLAAEIGVWYWTPGTNYVEVSANWRRLFGVPPDVQVTFETWRDALHPEDRERAVRELNAASDEHREFNVEYRAMHPDGTIRWIIDRGHGSYDENGRPVAMAGVNVDITERKQAEAALIRSEKLASVGRMAATIAHEINNPLAAVMNAVFLASENADSPGKVREALELADEELRRVAHLTRQTLGFYRESHAAAQISVNDVLDSSLDLLKSKIKSKRANVRKQYEADVELVAVAGELRQVFSNLVGNSLDAIADGGTVGVSVRPTEGPNAEPCVTVTVADNGSGMAPDALAHLFEPFFTTKESVGTGLGLWICKQLVERHGGSISVESATYGPHRGTTISVVLPINAESAHAHNDKLRVAKAVAARSMVR